MRKCCFKDIFGPIKCAVRESDVLTTHSLTSHFIGDTPGRFSDIENHKQLLTSSVIPLYVKVQEAVGVGAEAPTRNGPGLEKGRAQEELGTRKARGQEELRSMGEWTLAKKFNCMNQISRLGSIGAVFRDEPNEPPQWG